jgi:hypothetical protein
MAFPLTRCRAHDISDAKIFIRRIGAILRLAFQFDENCAIPVHFTSIAMGGGDSVILVREYGSGSNGQLILIKETLTVKGTGQVAKQAAQEINAHNGALTYSRG